MCLGKIGPKVNHKIDHFHVIRVIVRNDNPMKIQPMYEKKSQNEFQKIVESFHFQRTHGNNSGSSSA